MYKIVKDIKSKQDKLDLLNQELFLAILKWLKTELAYTSNNIEGNTLTREENALTIEEGITSGSKPLKDYIEARNHAIAFDYIVSLINQKSISYESVILKIHGIILNGINDDFKGRYRNIRVRIAGSNAVLPNPLKVPKLMKQLCEKLNDNQKNDILVALEAHYKLVEIHPFVDGNGRTARLLMNLILLRTGILPLIVLPIERKRYISSIRKRNTSDRFFQHYRYMLNLLNKSMDMYTKMFGTSMNEDAELLTIGKFAKLCRVPISTVRYYLKIKKLTPYSYTSSGYMLFAKEQSSVFI